MNSRPLAITIISWFLIVISVVNLLASPVSLSNPMAHELMAKSPIPVPVQFAMLYIGLTVTLVCGIAMLKGRNWGRWLYVIWSVFGWMVSLATSPMKMMLIPGLLVFLVLACILFWPNATAYFTQSGLRDEQNA